MNGVRITVSVYQAFKLQFGRLRHRRINLR